MLKKFNKAFGLEDTVDEERERFVQRINDTLFHSVSESSFWSNRWLRAVCVELGIGVESVKAFALREKTRFAVFPEDITRDDFHMTLRVVAALWHVMDETRVPSRSWVQEAVEGAFARATVDLGVIWRDGMFFPTGAEALDERLLYDPLRWLDEVPEVREHFRKAVADLAENRLVDSITSSFKTLERLAAVVLGNTRNLDNNKTELLQVVGLAPQWRSMLNNLLQYANDYARHASQAGVVLEPREVEAFTYQTGLMVRLILRATGRSAER